MASLAELYGNVATSYGKARAKARQIPANLRESGKGLASWAIDPYGEAQRVMGEYRNMTPEQRQGLVDAAVDLFGGVDVGPVGAIKASHGSPHLFDRFDFSKIGTGEGAQAYGHGLYFAEGFDSPVAKDYQQALSAKEGMQPTVNGKMLGEFYMDLERKANRLPPKLAEPEYEKLAFLEDLEQQPSFQKAFDRIDDERILPWAESLRSTYKPAGHLYNVSLEWPDAAREAVDPLSEHHLLNWDAPLIEQPATMQKAWEKFLRSKAAQSADQYMLGDIFEKKGKYANPTGADIYGALTEGLIGYGKPRPFKQVQQEASERLRKAGIPGIRYLDQASRGQGDGTRNYVMFDDRFPNIVTRNGVSITDLLKNK